MQQQRRDWDLRNLVAEGRREARVVQPPGLRRRQQCQEKQDNVAPPRLTPLPGRWRRWNDYRRLFRCRLENREIEIATRIRRRAHTGRLTDILQVFAGLETDSASWWDTNFLTRARVAADTAFARLDLEHAETAQLNPVASLHRHPHRIEHRVDSYLGLDLGDVSDLRNLVNDVDLDHPLAAPG